jgi:hypothetical protein
MAHHAAKQNDQQIKPRRKKSWDRMAALLLSFAALISYLVK